MPLWADILMVLGVGANITVNLVILWSIFRVSKNVVESIEHHNAFADVYDRMDHRANENAQTISNSLNDRADQILDKLDQIYRRQNTTARMIQDDRMMMKAHDERVRPAIDRLDRVTEELSRRNNKKEEY